VQAAQSRLTDNGRRTDGDDDDGGGATDAWEERREDEIIKLKTPSWSDDGERERVRAMERTIRRGDPFIRYDRFAFFGPPPPQREREKKNNEKQCDFRAHRRRLR